MEFHETIMIIFSNDEKWKIIYNKQNVDIKSVIFMIVDFPSVYYLRVFSTYFHSSVSLI